MSIRFVVVALATSVILPISAASAAVPTKEVAEAKKSPVADPAAAFALMNKMMERLFPAGPEPEPARLAIARQTTFAMFPKGTYGEAISSFAEGMADRVMSMSEADLAAMMPPAPALAADKKDAKGKTKAEAAKPKAPPSNEPLRVALARKDPQFDAKYAAGKAYVKTMIVKVGDVMEPKFREGMARSMARKFDAAQLAEINRFLATPTGAAYGRQMIGMWFEPDVMRSTFDAMPDLVKLMPDLMKDATALEAITNGGGGKKPAAKAD